MTAPLDISITRMGPAYVLALVRVSTVVALAPFFGGRQIPARAKAVFSFLVAWLMVPVVTAAAGAGGVELSYTTLLGEVAVGLVYGLTLGLMNEMLLIAGQFVGIQFSFSLVNLLDPASEIQTPLMSNLFQMLGVLTIITSGLDRLLLGSLMASVRAVPPGEVSLGLAPQAARTLVPMLAGCFFAALELAAPVLAATVLVEMGVSLIGKLSPQLPVVALTVPLKTLTGFVLLIGSLALWPRFIEGRFHTLLAVAERLVAQGGAH